VTPTVSDFALRIVHLPTNTYVQWAPGRELESIIVTELCDRVGEKGVGLLRDTRHVQDDIRAAFEELFLDLKKRV
jgi:hypothetical protein